jgi:hypothetical protein
VILLLILVLLLFVLAYLSREPSTLLCMNPEDWGARGGSNLLTQHTAHSSTISCSFCNRLFFHIINFINIKPPAIIIMNSTTSTIDLHHCSISRKKRQPSKTSVQYNTIAICVCGVDWACGGMVGQQQEQQQQQQHRLLLLLLACSSDGDIFRAISSFLPGRALLHLGQTCVSASSMLLDQQLWRPLIEGKARDLGLATRSPPADNAFAYLPIERIYHSRMKYAVDAIDGGGNASCSCSSSSSVHTYYRSLEALAALNSGLDFVDAVLLRASRGQHTAPMHLLLSLHLLHLKPGPLSDWHKRQLQGISSPGRLVGVLGEANTVLVVCQWELGAHNPAYGFRMRDHKRTERADLLWLIGQLKSSPPPAVFAVLQKVNGQADVTGLREPTLSFESGGGAQNRTLQD